MAWWIQVVDGAGGERSGEWPVTCADRTEDRPVGDTCGVDPILECGGAATPGAVAAEEDAKLGVVAVLVGLGTGKREDQAARVLGVVADVEGGDLRSAEGADFSDDEQSAVAKSGEVGFRRSAAGLPGRDRGTDVDHVPQVTAASAGSLDPGERSGYA